MVPNILNIKIKFELLNGMILMMGEESCHCSDLSNIYGNQCGLNEGPFTELCTKQENQICKSTGHLFKFLFLIYQQLYYSWKQFLHAALEKQTVTARGAMDSFPFLLLS